MSLVTIAYVLVIDHELSQLPLDIQHGTYHWFDIAALAGNDEVHINTKNYYWIWDVRYEIRDYHHREY